MKSRLDTKDNRKYITLRYLIANLGFGTIVPWPLIVYRVFVLSSVENNRRKIVRVFFLFSLYCRRTCILLMHFNIHLCAVIDHTTYVKSAFFARETKGRSSKTFFGSFSLFFRLGSLHTQNANPTTFKSLSVVCVRRPQGNAQLHSVNCLQYLNKDNLT